VPFCFIALVALAAWAPKAGAFSQYSTDGSTGNCASCHGDFRAANYVGLTDGQSWGNLHDLHQTMLSGDCDTCHSSGPRFPVILDDSAGGTGLQSISCVGCHGRSQDAGNDSISGGLGAGLRQHHWNTGTTSCVNCHTDANPANYTPVGENVLPNYYASPGTGHTNMPTDPCNPSGSEDFAGSTEGLDNDGDNIYDGADPDCQAVGVPTISVAPPSKDYGDVTVMSSSSQVFTISNGGGADLVLSDGVLSDETNFSLDLNGGTNPCGDVEPLTIGALDNCTVSVEFIPQTEAAFTATISITSNDTTNSPLIVDLTGNGVLGPAPNLAVTPASVDFGEVNVGDTPAVEVTLSNTGTDNLVVSGIALDNAAVYSLDETGGSNPCGSLTPTIVAGDNCTVDVIFAPAEDGGPFNAKVTITSNTPSVDVPLTGTGFFDTDGDGVGDSVDDFPDDDSKATPLAATGTGKITVDAGTNALSMVAAVAEGDVNQTGKPSGFTFPDGLVTFQVAVPGAGDNAVVTIMFPSGQPVGSQYFKADAGGFFEFAGATINTDNVSLLLTDGGSGDIDNTADAMITDPGGLATPVPSSSGGGSSGCSVIGSGGNGGGGAILFLTLLAILVTLRRQGAKARR